MQSKHSVKDLARKLAIPLSFTLVASCYFLSCASSTAQEKSPEATSSRGEPKLIVPVERKRLDVNMELPGELLAFRDVPLHAKVEGYISWIGVDRGSHVKKGQTLIKVSCPELDEKLREAEARKDVADSTYKESLSRYQSELERQAEAQTQLEADKLIADRLSEANKTPGAVAQNEVDQAQKKVEADQSRIHAIASNVKAIESLVASQKNNVKAAQRVLQSVQKMRSYLTITAPFDGDITERNVHEGSIVAVEASKNSDPLLRIQQRNKLRLVVAVPEAAVSGISIGKMLNFTVPAFIDKKFQGRIARPGYALNHETRTMPVELDVDNSRGELEPGMYAKVVWDESRSAESLFVPVSSVGSDLEGNFVIRVRDGNRAQRVPVHTGVPMGDLMEVEGKVAAGDTVLLRAEGRIDAEIQNGTRLANAKEITAANHRSAVGGE